MKREKYMSWHTYFMSIAVLSSFRSKDPKTQNGACIVDDNKRIVATGYNGLPRGLEDDNQDFWSDDDSNIRKSKHSYVVHAEANAIYNKNLASIDGSTLYVTCFPCRECAKAIIQNGIKHIVFLWEKNHHDDINKTVRYMFDEADVSYQSYGSLDITDKKFIEELQDEFVETYIEESD